MKEEYYREQEWQEFITNPEVWSFLARGFHFFVVEKNKDEYVRENVINACDLIITGKAKTKRLKIQELKYVLLNTFQTLLAIDGKSPKKYKNKLDFRETERLIHSFSQSVRQHIREYTIPQYGDYPDDQATILTVNDMVKSVRRRRTRLFKNSRENQDRLDLLKSAHECCMAYHKVCELKEGDENVA